MGVLGQALWAYYRQDETTPLIVECDRAADEEMKRQQFFLPFADMTELDRMALELAHGSVLDIGAGAGRHSLALQERGIHCTALEADSDCAALCRERGVNAVENRLWQEYAPGGVFDTAVALMNGAGLAGTYAGLPAYTDWLYSVLVPGGRVLLDTSTVTYLPKPHDPGRRPDEVWFRFRYGALRTEPFSWLFVSRSDLERNLRRAGFIHVQTLMVEYQGRALVSATKRS